MTTSREPSPAPAPAPALALALAAPSAAHPPSPQRTSVVAAARHQVTGLGFELALESGAAQEKLQLRAPGGEMCLEIRLARHGVEVSIAAAEIALSTKSSLRVDCQSIAFNAQEDIAISSQGSLRLASAKQLSIESRSVAVASTLGDLSLCANDDVRIEGERIRLNSPDLPHR
jgi:hypothetical protein